MRRIILSFAVALCAFAAGLTSTKIWQSYSTLPYCEVARNAEHYHGKIIRVRATLNFGADGLYVYEDCDPVSALASAVQLQDPKDVQNSIYVEVLLSGNKDKIKKAEAIILGHFDGEFSIGCWGPAFRIAASKIELVSPVSDYAQISSPSEGIQLRMRH